MRRINFDGKRFSRLLVVGEGEPYVSKSGRKDRQIICVCDCGETTLVRACHLRSGHTTSCGCYGDSVGGERARTHGKSFSSEFNSYNNMIARCYNPSLYAYKNYGGRGIQVCDDWIGKGGFEKFYAHLGNKPSSKHTLERIDTNGNYEPNNVKWATRQEQIISRRIAVHITFNGEKHFLMDLCEKFCVRYQTAYRMMKRGLSGDDIFGPHNQHVRHPKRERRSLQ